MVVELQGLVLDYYKVAEPVDEPGWTGSSRTSAKFKFISEMLKL